MNGHHATVFHRRKHYDFVLLAWNGLKYISLSQKLVVLHIMSSS